MVPIKTKKELLKKLNNINKSNSLGLVPTMGALHLGHASLIKRAVAENDFVVVSIFVNPTQFNNQEDLLKYPKTLTEDIDLIKKIASDIIVFAPTVADIYNNTTESNTYAFNGLEKVMEGAFRPGHFNGVGTIVEALFRLIEPERAYFGEKDFQQLRIIQKLTEIQRLPVQIVGCPIVREPHGLAMSSRNERLDPKVRKKASFIYDTLLSAKQKFGMDNAFKIKEWVTQEFNENTDFELEYFEITDVATLTPIQQKIENTKYRAFIAVFADNIRLIDNIALN
ncbi:pantoate--beta-alanine ligase [Maribacter chungangensis]|uniref:Pantothenate synthetase n=1 Tax=Maribacter chungangensis TaxID=1069117 RepID=A0ABW3B6V8_9FLAO